MYIALLPQFSSVDSKTLMTSLLLAEVLCCYWFYVGEENEFGISYV